MISRGNETRDGAPGWPELPLPDDWAETFSTLHMWLQIIGKIRLARSPWANHSWGSALYLTATGFTTSPMFNGTDTFEIALDFVNHELRIMKSDGQRREMRLEPMAVADFHRRLFALLEEIGIRVSIFTRPVEVAQALRFEDDRQHASYDAAIANRVWRAFAHADRVFKVFRAEYIGKSSPSHFFWGAFDLAVTRFSGRTAPLHPGGAPNCADWVMQEAYSHELASAGFWPGAGFGEAAFYAYAWPEPPGYSSCKVAPDAAHYSDALKEFILPYEAVRTADNPDETLLAFLHATYEAAAELGKWNRGALESHPDPGHARRNGGS